MISIKTFLAICFATLCAAATQAASKIDGMYLMTRFAFNTFETTAFYFKDGEVFEHPKGGTDFAAFKKDSPKRAGKFSLSADEKKMRIEWGGGRRTIDTKVEWSDGGCFYFDGGLFCPAAPFKKDTKIEGHFSGGATAGGGTSAFVSSSTTLQLSKDGTYTLSKAGSASLNAGGSSYGSSSENAETGTYQLDSYTLALTPKKGNPHKHTVFLKDDFLYFEGVMLKKSEKE